MRGAQVRLLAVIFGLLISDAASAKRIAECNGLMVTPSSRCEVSVQFDCLGRCTPRHMLKGCAESMVPACREVCQDPPPPVCTGDCGGTCEARCRVDPLVCKNGCVGECTASCASDCADAKDPRHCRAACEANCGNECDVQCAELPVDAPCLEHCYKCCSGSCTAQANLDCQLECQEGGMAGCTDGALAECTAGCDADGALFCDGQFVEAGLEMSNCIVALRRHRVPVSLDTDVDLDTLRGAAQQWRDGDLDDTRGCLASVTGAADAPLWLLALGVLAVRRRRG